MFGRFRKTNDPAQETDGGAIAAEERERDEPATRRGARADRVTEPRDKRRARHGGGHACSDPAARERRLAELKETESGDADTRVADATAWSSATASPRGARAADERGVGGRGTSRARCPPSSARTPWSPCATASATASGASAGAAPSSGC